MSSALPETAADATPPPRAAVAGKADALEPTTAGGEDCSRSSGGVFMVFIVFKNSTESLVKFSHWPVAQLQELYTMQNISLLSDD